MSKAISTKRSLIEQATQAAFKVFGSWKNIRVLIIGEVFLNEKPFLLSKGVTEDNISTVNFDGDWESALSTQSHEIVLLSIQNSELKGQYETLIHNLQKLRDNTQTKRILCIENELVGFNKQIKINDPSESLKQIYLSILKELENELGEAYISFHDKLLKDIKSEDYEKRIINIANNESIKDSTTKEIVQSLFVNAQIISLYKEHSSKTFESGFIAGNNDELEKIYKLFKPKGNWADFKKGFPKNNDEKLCFQKLSSNQTDPDYPQTISETWAELEELAGKFFDLQCNKAFNQLDGAEKYILTGDSKYEDVQQEEASSSNKTPEINANFRRFELDSNPLGGMMGGNPLFGGGATAAPSPKSSKKYFNLKEYGETFIAMIAAWHRQCVYTGGALFEYLYKNDDDQTIQGCVITLSINKDLLIQVNQLSESLDLPNLKNNVDGKKVLDIFFTFKKNYTNYYDKVRNLLKSSHDFYIGTIKKEDYEALQKQEESISEKFEVNLDSIKEKKRKQQKIAESLKKGRLSAIKSQKVSKIKEYLETTDGEISEEIIELDLNDAELDELNNSLEMKRMELEEKLDTQRQHREALEAEIEKEKAERDAKRQEIELERQRKKEEMLQERLKRQQRLQEERKKREDVKKLRAKNLREAFEKAREAAIKKQEVKSVNKQDSTQEDKKKNEKKKYNPEAVKMMIRFGTSDKKIESSTGISTEDLAELKSIVAEEDAKL